MVLKRGVLWQSQRQLVRISWRDVCGKEKDWGGEEEGGRGWLKGNTNTGPPVDEGLRSLVREG